MDEIEECAGLKLLMKYSLVTKVVEEVPDVGTVISYVLRITPNKLTLINYCPKCGKHLTKDTSESKPLPRLSNVMSNMY